VTARCKDCVRPCTGRTQSLHLAVATAVDSLFWRFKHKSLESGTPGRWTHLNRSAGIALVAHDNQICTGRASGQARGSVDVRPRAGRALNQLEVTEDHSDDRRRTGDGQWTAGIIRTAKNVTRGESSYCKPSTALLSTDGLWRARYPTASVINFVVESKRVAPQRLAAAGADVPSVVNA